MKRYSKLWKRVANGNSGYNEHLFEIGKIYSSAHIMSMNYSPPNLWNPRSDWTPVDFETYYKQITDDIRNNS